MGKTTFDDGTFMSPRALQEMLTRMATSETLKAIRANANEGAKETRRVPKRGRRDDGSYDVELRGEALKTWSAPELVHARAEESAAFFPGFGERRRIARARATRATRRAEAKFV